MRRLSFPLSIHTHSEKERAVRRHLGLLIFVLFAALTLLLIAPLAAREPRRTQPPSTFISLGPPGGSIVDLAAGADGTIYTAVEDGALYRLSAPGQRWEDISRDLVRYTVFAVEVDPFNPSVVYAAVWNRLYRSGDRGDTWTLLPEGPPGEGLIYDLSADPLTPGRLYLAGSEEIFVSEDGGQTWSVPEGIDLPRFRILADPYTADRAFTWSPSRFYTTVDGGETWREKTEGLPPFPNPSVVTVLPSSSEGGTPHLVDQVPTGTPDRAFALFRLREPEGIWEEVAPVPGPTVDLIADPADPERLLLATAREGIWTSEDRGLTWSRSAGVADGETLWRLVADPVEAGVFYAGLRRQGGIYRSVDGGATWERREEGLLASAAQVVGLDPAAHRLYVNAEGPNSEGLVGRGPYVRDPAHAPETDGWRPLTGPFGAETARLLGVNPHRPRELFVVDTGADGASLYRSRNRGRSWEQVAPNLSEADALFFDPFQADRVYSRRRTSLGTAAYHLSTDGGSTFAPLSDTGVHPAFSPDEPGLIYAAGAVAGFGAQPAVGFVERSRDGGLSWEPLPAPASVEAGPIVVAPGTGTVFVVLDSELWRSRDEGETWERTGLPRAVVSHLALPPDEPGTIYAVLDFGRELPPSPDPPGLYRSTDGGDTWELFDRGLTSAVFLSLDVFPSAPNAVYAGTAGGGVQRVVFPSPRLGPELCPEGPGRRLCYRIPRQLQKGGPR